MPRTTSPTIRPVGAKTAVALHKQYHDKKILVFRQETCSGWTDEKTGQSFSAHGSFAHRGTRASFFAITGFAYKGRKLGLVCKRLPTNYIEGDDATRGDVVVKPNVDTLPSADSGGEWLPVDYIGKNDDTSASLDVWDGEPLSLQQ